MRKQKVYIFHIFFQIATFLKTSVHMQIYMYKSSRVGHIRAFRLQQGSAALDERACCDERFSHQQDIAGDATIMGENSSVETICSRNGNSSRFPGTRRSASSELATNVKDQKAFGSTVTLFGSCRQPNDKILLVNEKKQTEETWYTKVRYIFS